MACRVSDIYIYIICTVLSRESHKISDPEGYVGHERCHCRGRSTDVIDDSIYCMTSRILDYALTVSYCTVLA
jgi:hypothetical protein